MTAANYETKDVHISTIKAGDTIEHNGELLTVCNYDIRHSEFMGATLFGDSYRLGRKPVKKANIITTLA